MLLNDEDFANTFMRFFHSIIKISGEAKEKISDNTTPMNNKIVQEILSEQNLKVIKFVRARIVSKTVINDKNRKTKISTRAFPTATFNRFELIMKLLEHVQWLDKFYNGIGWRKNNQCDFSYDYTEVRQFVFDNIPILDLIKHSQDEISFLCQNIGIDLFNMDMDADLFEDTRGEEYIMPYDCILENMLVQVEKEPQKYMGKKIEFINTILENPPQCISSLSKLITFVDNSNENDNKYDPINKKKSSIYEMRLIPPTISAYEIIKIIMKVKMVLEDFRRKNNLKDSTFLHAIFYLYFDDDKDKYTGGPK